VSSEERREEGGNERDAKNSKILPQRLELEALTKG